MQMFAFLRAAVLGLALVMGIAGHSNTVAAHAIVLDSTPAAGAIVTGADQAITLRFNGRIDAGRSRLALAGPDGKVRVLAVSSDKRLEDFPDVPTYKEKGWNEQKNNSPHFET